MLEPPHERRKHRLLGSVAAAVVSATVACAPTPWGDPNYDPDPYLHVFAAEQQPQSSSLGVIMEAQSWSGNYLSLVVQQGTMSVWPGGDAGGATTAACLPVTNGQPLTFLVLPAQTEAIIFANLYNLGSNTATPSWGTLCSTNQQPVASQVLSVLSGGASISAGPSDGGAQEGSSTLNADAGPGTESGPSDSSAESQSDSPSDSERSQEGGQVD
jgi:hypothetical protein